MYQLTMILSRIPRLMVPNQKMRREIKDWGDYKKLPELIPEYPLIRRMLLRADSILDTPRLRAIKVNERRMAKISKSVDPCFIGRNDAVLQCTQFAHMDASTRRRMSNAAAPKPGRFEKEWVKLELARNVMRGKEEVHEAALILMSVNPELAISVELLTRTALASFGCEEIKIKQTENNEKSAGKLVVPKCSKMND